MFFYLEKIIESHLDKIFRKVARVLALVVTQVHLVGHRADL